MGKRKLVETKMFSKKLVSVSKFIFFTSSIIFIVSILERMDILEIFPPNRYIILISGLIMVASMFLIAYGLSCPALEVERQREEARRRVSQEIDNSPNKQKIRSRNIFE